MNWFNSCQSFNEANLAKTIEVRKMLTMPLSFISSVISFFVADGPRTDRNLSGKREKRHQDLKMAEIYLASCGNMHK